MAVATPAATQVALPRHPMVTATQAEEATLPITMVVAAEEERTKRVKTVLTLAD